MQVRLIPRADYEREKAAGGGLASEFAPMHGTPYGMVRGPVLGPLGIPCAPPPWGLMGAVSLDTGEILWKVPLGTVPDRIPFALFEQGLPSLSGVLVTAGGLVLSGNTTDGYLRALDVETGAELWRDRLPAARRREPDDVQRRRAAARRDRRRRPRQARHAPRRLGGGVRVAEAVSATAAAGRGSSPPPHSSRADVRPRSRAHARVAPRPRSTSR